MNAAPITVNPTVPAFGGSHVVLRRRSERRPCYVSDFPGPLSIKAVVRGDALWETREGRFRIDEGSYLVLNEGHHHSVIVGPGVETFCVFFARGFVEDVLHASVTSDAGLLEEPEAPLGTPVDFVEAVLPHDDSVSPEMTRLRRSLDAGEMSQLWLEGRLRALGVGLLASHERVKESIRRLPAVRRATREELFRRLLRGRDFIEASLGDPLTIKGIAREACLSEHHFHRRFRELFSETPGRYITRRRLQRAHKLLESSSQSVTEVCSRVGFQSLGSFSTLFRRRFGISPRELRFGAKKERSSATPP